MILAECPICHKKQGIRNKVCSCGENLENAKRCKNKVRYWVRYRLPGGKQKKEYVGFSIEDARDADGKRRVQKRENRIFEILPESKIAFEELAKWYLELKSVQKLSSYERVKTCIGKFNKILGARPVGTLKPEDLEDYQNRREDEGCAPATIDMELSIVKTMVTKAFDNDKIDARAVKAFRRVGRKLKKGSNARDRILTIEEYLELLNAAPVHLKGILAVAMNTGMRAGEIFSLRWSHTDWDKGFIRLPAELTKERRRKDIPINDNVKAILSTLPRHINHDFVFTYRGSPIKTRTRRSLASAADKAGIVYGMNKEGGFRLHDLRATMDTYMDAAGVRESVRKKILGHVPQDMDQHYLRLKDEELRQGMEKYTQWLNVEVEKIRASGPQNGPQAFQKH